MKHTILYLKAEQNVEITNKRVYLGDLAKLFSSDTKVVNQLNREVVMVIKATQNTNYVISIMKLIELITKVYPEIEVVNIGESDFVLSYKIPKREQKVYEYVKAGFAALIVFFGAAFTIMTFNTDVSVEDVFNKFYTLVMGQSKTGGSILEFTYSIGLFIGIVVFFNHFSRLKIHDDPTPIQIEMRNYEEDVNTTLIKDASREGKTIDSN